MGIRRYPLGILVKIANHRYIGSQFLVFSLISQFSIHWDLFSVIPGPANGDNASCEFVYFRPAALVLSQGNLPVGSFVLSNVRWNLLQLYGDLRFSVFDFSVICSSTGHMRQRL